jgi:signal transduction histidine kinase
MTSAVRGAKVKAVAQGETARVMSERFTGAGEALDEQRHAEGLQRVGAIARELVVEGSLEVLLQRIADEARFLLDASFSAVLLLREGSATEVQHFFYNGPRHLFPARLPRAVGLLAVAIETGAPVRAADVRDHPAAVGMPVEHPPIAALVAAPIIAGGRVLGEVAVAEPPGEHQFTDLDEFLLAEFAAYAATAVSLAAARRAAQQAEELRAAMREVALHNLRTPLSVAESGLDLLRHHGERIGPDEKERLFTTVEGAHRRIRDLAEGALAGEGGTELDPVPNDGEVDPRALVDALLTDLRDAGPVQLAGVVDDDVPTTFRGDHRLVREALENLLTNAIKFSPRGRAVTITARIEGRSVRFDVTDRGPGIPPEEQARLFGPLHPDVVRATRRGGGRGLSIVRRLVEGHGGTVGVSSRPGQGSTFWVTFPLVNA